MYCNACGAQNADQNIHCVKCGAKLQAGALEAPHSAPASGGGIEVLIPYKNGAALTAYYLGIFSLVCGLFLGVPALILGLRGLSYADLHPEARGKAHAWTGIILGGLTTLASLVVLAVVIAGLRR